MIEYHKQYSTKMPTKKFKRISVVVIALFSIIMLNMVFSLLTKYGQLFYLETYLSKKLLPLQRRPEKEFERGQQYSQFNHSASRILCLIVTSPKYHQSRAVHVAATWARHCSRAVFLTSSYDLSLPDSFVVPSAEGYNDLWEKVTRGFDWIYEEKLLESFDWVVKVDDDTFVIVENLAEALKPYNPHKLLAIGQKLLTWETKDVYLNGGAGYVLSRGAVKTLVSDGLRKKKCINNLQLGSNEDVNMALCLKYLDVTFLDVKDADGRMQFHIYPPEVLIDPRQAFAWSHLWLKAISVHPYPFGFTELTNQPISFHYVNAENMYLLYYLIYVVNPYKRDDRSNRKLRIKKEM